MLFLYFATKLVTLILYRLLLLLVIITSNIILSIYQSLNDSIHKCQLRCFLIIWREKKITFAKSSVDQYVLIIVQIKFVQNISPEIYKELLLFFHTNNIFFLKQKLVLWMQCVSLCFQSVRTTTNYVCKLLTIFTSISALLAPARQNIINMETIEWRSVRL